MLRDLYYQEDNYLELGNCRVAESYDEEVFKSFCVIRQFTLTTRSEICNHTMLVP